MENRTKLFVHEGQNSMSYHTPLPPVFPSYHDTPTCAELRIDNTVLVQHCPPISAGKRFTLEKILKSQETERDKMHTCRPDNTLLKV